MKTTFAMLAVLSLLLIGCEREGPVEEGLEDTGRAIEQGAENAGDRVEQSTDRMNQ